MYGDPEEQIDFCLRASVAGLSESEVRLLVQELTRGPEGVLDLSDGRGARLVCAVVERAQSEDDAADLVPLGSTGGPDALGPLLASAVDAAMELARTGPRKRLDVTIAATLAAHAPLLEARGFTPELASYIMETPDASLRPTPPPAPLRFVDWNPDISAEAVLNLVRRAFTGSPGFRTMPLDALRERLATAHPPARMLLDGDRLAGLCRVRAPAEDGLGYVNLIARDPSWRGRGLGDALLGEATRLLAAHGARRFGLDVVAVNTSALALYTRHGFQRVSVETTWCHAL